MGRVVSVKKIANFKKLFLKLFWRNDNFFYICSPLEIAGFFMLRFLGMKSLKADVAQLARAADL